MTLVRGILTALLCLLGLQAGQANAASSGWSDNAEASVRLISTVSAVGAMEEVRLGLEIVLQPGWKTYWRSPGDGGLPPSLDWTQSDNVAGAEIRWPAPRRFEILGIDSIGYENAVIFPIDIALARPGEPLTARFMVDYLTCKDICVPHRADLTLHLPAGEPAPSAEAFAINQARGQVPGPSMPGFSVASARMVAGDGGNWWLHLETAGALADPDAFVEVADPAIGFGAPERLGPALLRVPVLYGVTEPASLASQMVTVTLTDRDRAVEQRVAVEMAAPAAAGWGVWLTILATAFLGGLILNLMPCVLPVLSIKLLSVLRHGGGPGSAARASFLATSAGIVVSFAALAGAAIGLKAAGIAVGWGIQFQEPAFIIFMAMVCTLFAANLWGLFEVPMPAAIGRLGTGHAGSFATGFFATLLATPCSAPFVGTAVAFALSQGSAETMAIFLAMGLGLAAPYLAVAIRPQMVTALPKPGRWMIWVRAVLGLALAGTAVWLGTILWSLAGAPATIGLGVLAAALLLWLALPAAALRLPVAAALVLAGLAVPSVLSLSGRQGPAPGEWQSTVWRPFSQAYLADLVASGRTVMVDVTADWCITCKANKAAVLDRGEVARLLGAEVTALQADWTRPDPSIQAYLASFGRYGIPFNAVYGPGAPEGIPLPEILTESAVLAAVEKASAKRQ